MNARTGAAYSLPRGSAGGDGDGAPVPQAPPVPGQSVPEREVPERAAAAPAQNALAEAAPSKTAPPVARTAADGRAVPGGPGTAQSPSGPPRPRPAPPVSVPAATPSARADGREPGRPEEEPASGGPQGTPACTADAASVANLLCCWVRESDIPAPAEGEPLLLPMRATGVTVRVPVRYWSPTGRHAFGPPLIDGAGEGAPPLDAVALAALIAREAAHLAGDGRSGVRRRPVDGADLVARVADSVRRAVDFLTERTARPQSPPGSGPFLDAEQALVLGHPLHPAPKSRQGLSDEENLAYSPEVRGAFRLHWMAVDESVLACDSSWTERGRTVAAGRLAARLAGEALTARLPAGSVPLPLHPWQAHRLRHRPAVARLLADGLLRDLGEAGEPWHPTSSVRTVMQPGGPAMLKLSLALPITNSRRENLRKELLRGLEVHRLLRSGLGAQWRAVHPGFDIVRDPAWLGVDEPGGEPLPGLDTVVRHNPFGPGDDAVCVAGLTAERPWPGAPGGMLRSRLAEIVEEIAARTGRSARTVATEWFLRYLDAVVSPVLWLDAHAGIALEAHQQNTLVLLDADGWPAGGRYRDNQGYYFRESRRDALGQRLPGARLGAASDSFVEDAVVDERFAYYLGINNVLGLIGALGVQRLADEHVLLAAARRFLRSQAGREGPGPVASLPAMLLESPTLRCKANLLTRLNGMDELVGPVDTQSVYVTVANPLCR